MANGQINILLVGDYLIFRTGLRMLLETDPRFRVVGEAANAAEAANMIGPTSPDLLLMDGPEIETPDFPELIAGKAEGIPILVLAPQESPELFRRCFEVGAGGLISKEHGAEFLFRAIERVHAGELWFDRRSMGRTIRQLMTEKEDGRGGGAGTNCPSLSDREREVLALICRGLKNRAIAESLFISETTVRHHLTSIFEKLEVSSRLQLVVLAFREKLVEVPARVSDAELSLG